MESRRRAAGVEPEAMKADMRRTNPAFAALAENVRDYAVFLLNPEGVIVY